MNPLLRDVLIGTGIGIVLFATITTMLLFAGKF